jgi:hypothetical protein
MTIILELLDRHIKAVEHAIRGQAGVTVESYVQVRMTRWLEELVAARRDDRNAELLSLYQASSNDVKQQVRALLGQAGD